MIDRRMRAAAGAAGAAAVVWSAALFFAPDAVGAVLPVAAIAESTTLSAGGTRALAFVAVGAGCLLWIAASTRGDGRNSQSGVDFPTLEAADPGDGAAVGSGFDRNLRVTLEAAAEGDDRDDVRADLRSLAVEALVSVEGCAREAARERVADGEWTDDRVAAAYLAGEATEPLPRRLVARVRPRASKRRRVERTVAAVERLLGERRPN
jgi:hypothetical protein